MIESCLMYRSSGMNLGSNHTTSFACERYRCLFLIKHYKGSLRDKMEWVCSVGGWDDFVFSVVSNDDSLAEWLRR